MTVLKLKESELGGDLKYAFLNASEHPLSREDYGKLKGNGFQYHNPRKYYDSEYGDEAWLLWGNRAHAYTEGYYFDDAGVELARSLGYNVEIDALEDQQERQRIHQEKVNKRRRLYDAIRRLIQQCGDRPKEVFLNGERIYTPFSNESSIIYGGGEWFVIESEGEFEGIWYVQNNGSDGGCWAWNNVATGGAGAIGWRIPYDKYIEDKIEMTKKPIDEITEDDDYSFELPSEYETTLTVFMRTDGRKYREIEEGLGISHGKVYRILKKKELTNRAS